MEQPPAPNRKVGRGPKEQASGRAPAVGVPLPGLSAVREHPAPPARRQGDVVAGIGRRSGEPRRRDDVGAGARGGRRPVPHPQRDVQDLHRRRHHRDPAERPHRPAALGPIAKTVEGRPQLDAIEEPDCDGAVRAPSVEGLARRGALAVAVQGPAVRASDAETRIGCRGRQVRQHRRHGDVEQPRAVPQARRDSGGLGARRDELRRESQRAGDARQAGPDGRAHHASEPPEPPRHDAGPAARARHPASALGASAVRSVAAAVEDEDPSRLRLRQIRHTQTRIRIQAAA